MMTHKWIKCNLPYSYSDGLLFPKLPKEPNLDRKGKKLFGSTLKEVSDATFGVGNSFMTGKVADKLFKAQQALEVKLNFDQTKIDKALAKKNDPTISKCSAYYEFHRTWKKWYEKQPEYLA